MFWKILKFTDLLGKRDLKKKSKNHFISASKNPESCCPQRGFTAASFCEQSSLRRASLFCTRPRKAQLTTRKGGCRPRVGSGEPQPGPTGRAGVTWAARGGGGAGLRWPPRRGAGGGQRAEGGRPQAALSAGGRAGRSPQSSAPAQATPGNAHIRETCGGARRQRHRVEGKMAAAAMAWC